MQTWTKYNSKIIRILIFDDYCIMKRKHNGTVISRWRFKVVSVVSSEILTTSQDRALSYCSYWGWSDALDRRVPRNPFVPQRVRDRNHKYRTVVNSIKLAPRRHKYHRDTSPMQTLYWTRHFLTIGTSETAFLESCDKDFVAICLRHCRPLDHRLSLP